jgi:hypothetical protein
VDLNLNLNFHLVLNLNSQSEQYLELKKLTTCATGPQSDVEERWILRRVINTNQSNIRNSSNSPDAPLGANQMKMQSARSCAQKIGASTHMSHQSEQPI